jgi:copper chaperone
MRQIVMTIDGMSCGECVSAVRKALGAVPGTCLDEVSVGSATVSYDVSIASPAAIADAIGNAGYHVRGEPRSGPHAMSPSGDVMRRHPWALL